MSDRNDRVANNGDKHVAPNIPDLDDPLKVIANLPYIIGSELSEILILIAKCPDQPSDHLVFGIPLDDAENETASLFEIILELMLNGRKQIHGFVVSEKFWHGGADRSERFAHFAESLNRHGIELLGLHGVKHVAEGEPVTDAGGILAGLLPDPAESVFAKSYAARGLVLAPDRFALEASFDRIEEAPVDEDGDPIDVATIQTAAWQRGSIVSNDLRHNPAVAHAWIVNIHREFLDLAYDLRHAGLRIDQALSDRFHLEVIAEAVCNDTNRDMVIAAFVNDGDTSEILADLWLDAARIFGGRTRVTALTLWAIRRLIVGDEIEAQAGFARAAREAHESDLDDVRESGTLPMLLLSLARTNDSEKTLIEVIAAMMAKMEQFGFELGFNR